MNYDSHDIYDDVSQMAVASCGGQAEAAAIEQGGQEQ